MNGRWQLIGLYQAQRTRVQIVVLGWSMMARHVANIVENAGMTVAPEFGKSNRHD